jgi:sarcosine oxidase, subunit beta
MKTDVLVVGGGITGCTLAYLLAKNGTQVTVVEQYDLNTQASGSNAGSIHGQMDYGLFEGGRESDLQKHTPFLPFLMEAIKFWQAIEQELKADFELEITGGLLVTDRVDQMPVIERKVAYERRLGLETNVLSADDVRRVAPYINETAVGGELVSTEGQANALVAAPALASAAQSHGATFMINTLVKALSTTRAGFVGDTSKGRIESKIVVNCAGTFGGAVSKLLGVESPIFGKPIQVSVTEPAAPLVRHLVYYAAGKLTLKQTKRGALLIGGGWPSRADTTGRLSLRLESVRDNLRVCQHLVPRSRSIRVVRTWPALVNETGDDLPVIGEVAAVPGYYVASFPGKGFTAGPLAANVIANLILGKTQDIDISTFSPNRFR